MLKSKTIQSPAQTAQTFQNGEVHDWYRIILGYSDHLVGGLMDEFHLRENDTVLDPFCGSGTTLVEGMKRGLAVTGIDANPSSCFAAIVKTNWTIDPAILGLQLQTLRSKYRRALARKDVQNDAFYRYLADFGYLRRWISIKPARKIVALKRAIKGLRVTPQYKNALMLALVAEAVDGSSNVKFGPELYCGRPKQDSAVFANFESRVEKMCDDLNLTAETAHGSARVLLGDARKCGRYLRKKGQFTALICSPPYPTEHDYTRNSRIELALLGYVENHQTVRDIKTQMIRSHTKGVYVTDRDGDLVAHHRAIQKLARAIDKRAESKTYGFARLYSKVLREYFGGLKLHFQAVLPLMAPGAMCAYVVGDQSSYLQVHIPTAKLLASLAVECGFEHIETRHWRHRWSTTMSRQISENILLLRAPRADKKSIRTNR